MDKLLLCEVSVNDHNSEFNAKPEDLAQKSTFCDNTRKVDLHVSDIVPGTTMWGEENKAGTKGGVTHGLHSYYVSSHKDESKFKKADSNTNNSETPCSEMQPNPVDSEVSRKRTYPDSASMGSIVSPKKRHCNEIDAVPGTSAEIPPRSKKRIERSPSSSMSEESLESHDGSDFELHDSDDSNGPGPYGSLDGFRHDDEESIMAKMGNLPNSDELLYCVDCQCAWEGDCPEHGPLNVIEDTAVPSSVGAKSPAEGSAPAAVKIDASNGKVLCVEDIPNRTRFGPFKGKVGPPEEVNPFTRPIFKNGKLEHCIDASDPGASNWMRFVRRVEDDVARNLDAFQFKGQIYFRSIRRISPGEELVVGCNTSQGVLFGEKEDGPTGGNPGQLKNAPSAKPCVICSTKHNYLGLIRTELSDQLWCCLCLAKHDLNKLGITLKGAKPYECSTCIKPFDKKHALLLHLRRHSGVKPYFCQVCNLRFSEGWILKRHVRTHTGEKPFDCPVCDQQFSRNSDVARHMRVHTGEKPFECPECSQRFSQKVHLSLHMRSHSNETPYECSVCGKGFTQRTHYVSHVRTHEVEDSLVCRECGKGFSDRESLREHVETHAKNESGEQSPGSENVVSDSGDVCSVKEANSADEMSDDANDQVTACTKCFIAEKYLGRIRTELDSQYWCATCFQENDLKRQSMILRGSKPFQCRVCRKNFSRKRDVILHLRAHSGDRPFSCSYCDRSFSKKWDFFNHVRTHTGEKPFQCGVCGQGFAMKNSLKKHSVVHSEDKPFPCTECDQRFSRKEVLNIHMRIHTGEKPYACTECDLRFTVQCAWKRHQRTHTGERPHTCLLCNQQFARKTDLTRHTRTHTGEKPFECAECNMRFAQKAHLTVHKRTHTGEKPFVCSLCNEGFTQKIQYMAHLRTAHPHEKNYVCEECGERFIDSSSLRRHSHTHKRPKNFVCSQCNERFSSKKNLNTHLKTHNAMGELIMKYQLPTM